MDEENQPKPEEQNAEPQVSPAEVPVEVQQEPKQVAGQTQVFVPKTTGAEEQKQSRLKKFKDFIVECRRVLRVTKKPDRTEFTTIVKIAGIGMAVIGFLGFLVHFVKELVF